jgi:hypothetical protein
MSSLQFRLAGQKARMLPHPAHLTCITQNCTSSLNPPHGGFEREIEYRYGSILFNP